MPGRVGHVVQGISSEPLRIPGTHQRFPPTPTTGSEPTITLPLPPRRPGPKQPGGPGYIERAGSPGKSPQTSSNAGAPSPSLQRLLDLRQSRSGPAWVNLLSFRREETPVRREGQPATQRRRGRQHQGQGQGLAAGRSTLLLVGHLCPRATETVHPAWRVEEESHATRVRAIQQRRGNYSKEASWALFPSVPLSCGSHSRDMAGLFDVWDELGSQRKRHS